MRVSTLKRVLFPLVATATTVLATAGLASAHIHPDPLAMAAGTTGTVGFAIEHGCDGSPTTDLQIQIPDGVTGVGPVAKDGWTSTITGNVVEFTGGSLAADVTDHFDLALTAPAQPGDVHFKIIQNCAQGELDWIEIAAAGAAEPAHPAPTLKVTQGPPTSADLTPEPESTDATGTVVINAAAPTSTSIIAVTTADSGNTGTIVVVAVVAAVVLIGGGVALARRRNGTPGA